MHLPHASKTAKNFGVSNISDCFLNLALHFIENSLALFFTTSDETSQLPDVWKEARVISIFKERQGGKV